MNKELVADQEIFQRSKLNTQNKIVASKYMNNSMLDILNQVKYFIERTIN